MREKRKLLHPSAFQKHKKLLPIFLLILILFTFPLLIFKRHSLQFSQSADIKNKSYSIDVDISPVISPSSRQGWLTFVYPTGGYHFEYPSDWKVNVSRNRYSKDNIYSVSLSYFQDNEPYRVDFMMGGRGGPNYDYEKREYKTLGGKTTLWTVMYRNKEPFEAVISFPDDDFDKYFVGLYVYLPQTNQEKFIKTLEEIIASIDT